MLAIGGLPFMINYATAATVLASASADPHDDGKGLPATGSPQATEDETSNDVGRDVVKPETVQPSASTQESADADPTSESIHEDDPRWDCTSMGNLQCGPSAQPVEYPQPVQLADTGVSVIELAIIGAVLCLVGAVAYFISLMIRHPER